jgi:NAD dependent epimerase/dehydratase family enzyme
VLNRPTVFSLPAPIARLMLGQLADELLLASQRVDPARLKESGYEYRHPELEEALRYLLEK